MNDETDESAELSQNKTRHKLG